MNIFNKTFRKYTHFLHQKYTKWSILKFKFHNSKNQSSAPQTISGSTDGNSRICCMTKEFKKFPRGHEAITSCWRHYDPNFKWRRYPWSPQRRLVIFTARPVENVFADDKLFVHCIQNCVLRQQHVYLFQDVKTRYFCNFKIA